MTMGSKVSKEYLAEYYQRNKEKILARSAEYYKKNQDNVSAYRSAWQKKNPEKRKVYSKKYSLNNKEKIAKKSKEWVKKNRVRVNATAMRCYYKSPEKFAARAHNRRCAGGVFTLADIKFLYKSQRGKCICCKKNLNGVYHVDHRVPLVRGGNNDRKNLDLLCPTCNLKKNAKEPLAFMRANGFLC